MGFLKELGLDYGWGTTAMMETLLETVHINAGTPWWASIGLSLLIVRLLLLKSYLAAADTSARNQLIAEYNAPIMARMRVAQSNRDQAGMQKAYKEMSDLRASAGVKYWKLFLPFLQIPIGFGAFRLMRGMSYLPVPGLDTGGPLWMQDLTVSDPLFILPIATAASYWYTFKVDTSSRGCIHPSANWFSEGWGRVWFHQHHDDPRNQEVLSLRPASIQRLDHVCLARRIADHFLHPSHDLNDTSCRSPTKLVPRYGRHPTPPRQQQAQKQLFGNNQQGCKRSLTARRSK
jgi:hypothetical protein